MQAQTRFDPLSSFRNKLFNKNGLEDQLNPDINLREKTRRTYEKQLDITESISEKIELNRQNEVGKVEKLKNRTLRKLDYSQANTIASTGAIAVTGAVCLSKKEEIARLLTMLSKKIGSQGKPYVGIILTVSAVVLTLGVGYAINKCLNPSKDNILIDIALGRPRTLNFSLKPRSNPILHFTNRCLGRHGEYGRQAKRIALINVINQIVDLEEALRFQISYFTYGAPTSVAPKTWEDVRETYAELSPKLTAFEKFQLIKNTEKYLEKLRVERFELVDKYNQI